MAFKLKKKISMYLFFLDTCSFERINMPSRRKVYASSVTNVWSLPTKIQNVQNQMFSFQNQSPLKTIAQRAHLHDEPVFTIYAFHSLKTINTNFNANRKLYQWKKSHSKLLIARIETSKPELLTLELRKARQGKSLTNE